MVDMTLDNQEPRIYRLDLGYLIFRKSPSCYKIVKRVKNFFALKSNLMMSTLSHYSLQDLYLETSLVTKTSSVQENKPKDHFNGTWQI